MRARRAVRAGQCCDERYSLDREPGRRQRQHRERCCLTRSHGDRGFESISLQRRVQCELDRTSGCGPLQVRPGLPGGDTVWRRDRGRRVAGFGWGTIIAPDTEICPNHGIPFRRMSFHEAIAFRIYRIRARADQNRPLPISVPKTAIFLPCGAPVPAYCRSGIPVLRSLSPMKVTLRRAPGDACSIRRSDHDKRQY